MPKLQEIQDDGNPLLNMDSNIPLSEKKLQPTHANVYVGSASITEALDSGADIILAGRVADPCLTLGILVHHFGWDMNNDLDKLASGIAIGHLLECGGQASGGNSYAEWPMDYKINNLGYPIAEVSEDGSAVFSILDSQGGKMSRDTIREQLVYEIHDPANYITPDVTVDLTEVCIKDIGTNRVQFSGPKGKLRPELLKMTIGLMEGYLTEQFFFFSWPYAYKKAEKFIDAVKIIWQGLPISLDRIEHTFIGLNGITPSAPIPDEKTLDELNEIGVRMAIKHQDKRAGKMAIQAIVCLGLNGPPGNISTPGWGNNGRAMLSLWPTLIPRNLVQMKIELIDS
jgi:hypothetical protein